MAKHHHRPDVEPGLQKFTDSEEKITCLLSLPKIKPEDLEQLNEHEKVLLEHKLAVIYNSLTVEERDKFSEKIEDIITDNQKNEVWKYNNAVITFAISKLMREMGRMPTKQSIAKETKLSRVTVHKHLKDHRNHPFYGENMERLQFMALKVLSEVFKLAVEGDVRAARLYLEVVGNLGVNQASKSVNHQNNYIQLNSITISQDTVKQLQPEQINQIEAILKNTVSVTQTAIPNNRQD